MLGAVNNIDLKRYLISSNCSCRENDTLAHSIMFSLRKDTGKIEHSNNGKMISHLDIEHKCAIIGLYKMRCCRILSQEDAYKICRGIIGGFTCTNHTEEVLCPTLIFENQSLFDGYPGHDINVAFSGNEWYPGYGFLILMAVIFLLVMYKGHN